MTTTKPMRIDKIRERSKDKVLDQFYSESINTSNSKINKNEIQNKVNKYYRQINNGVNNSPPNQKKSSQIGQISQIPLTYVAKDSFGSSYKDKLSNMDKIRNNMNIFKDKR